MGNDAENRLEMLENKCTFSFCGKAKNWIKYKHTEFSHPGDMTGEEAAIVGNRLAEKYNSDEKENRLIRRLVKSSVMSGAAAATPENPVVISWSEYRTIYAIALHLDGEKINFEIAGVSHILGT